MKNLLGELRNRAVSVSSCAKLMCMSKRTLQDHLDTPGRLTDVEEKQLRLIIRSHDDLVELVNNVK